MKVNFLAEMRGNFHFIKKEKAGKFSPTFFQKVAQSRARSPCRTPQSAELPLALQTDCVPQAVWKERKPPLTGGFRSFTPARPDRARVRLLTNLFSKKRYVKVNKKQINSYVRTCKAGCGGEAPARKNVVILRRRPHDRVFAFGKWAAKESRAAPIYKRGAVPVRRSLMCINVKLKSNVVVRTFERQNNTKSLCNFDTTQ